MACRGAFQSETRRHLRLERLENRHLLSVAESLASASDRQPGLGSTAADPFPSCRLSVQDASVYPISTSTSPPIQETMALVALPNLTGTWHGPMTETNPLGTTTFAMTLSIKANPMATNIFTGVMRDGAGNTARFLGTLSRAGRVVINVETQGMFIIFQLVGQLTANRYIAGTVSIIDRYGGQTTGTFDFSRGRPADVVATKMFWNPKRGGLTLRYDIRGGSLPADKAPEVALFWATGATWAERSERISLGSPIPSMGTLGMYTYNVPGWKLRNSPAGTTHLLLVLDPDERVPDVDRSNNVFALADVSVTYDSVSVPRVLSDATIGLIKDALRYAGQKSATITSTSRTPRGQAEEMYNKLLGKNKAGIDKQRGLYMQPGKDVIDTILQSRAAHRQEKDPVARKNAVVADVMSQYPAGDIVFWGGVSVHCGDYTKRQAADISPLRVKGTISPRMLARALAADAKFIGIKPANSNGRIDKLLLPSPGKEDAFHVEVQQKPEP